uniref:Peroxidase n=1 Tax=Kalanchoe fedtschenkoi TaxID=63787 RepID=A0A7N0ZW34_KALFE
MGFSELRSSPLIFFLINAAFILNAASAAPADLLSFGHYHATCPSLEGIIQNRLTAWFLKDPTLAPALIRLHFHDCAVRGCDASILLNLAGSERRAAASETLRGFEVMDDIKAAVEKHCPKTVSCADILTAAARDATVHVGGPFWEVPFGRKDGKVSIGKEADTVPNGRENITALISYFNARGLNLLDLVVLSGSHTIGRSTCHSIKHRLYNFNGTRRPDPSLDFKYLYLLRKKCKSDYVYTDLDVTTPKTFDTVYYANLMKNKGLLSTDQLLYSDPRTASFVPLLATSPQLFDSQFAASMIKLGNVNVKTGKMDGEIRRNCNFLNR